MKRSICLFYLLLFYRPMLERVASHLSINLFYASVRMNHAKYQEIDQEVFQTKRSGGFFPRIKFWLDKKVLDTFYREDQKVNKTDYLEEHKRKIEKPRKPLLPTGPPYSSIIKREPDRGREH